MALLVFNWGSRYDSSSWRANETDSALVGLYRLASLSPPLGFNWGSRYDSSSWLANETDTAFALSVTKSNAVGGWWPPFGFKWGDYLGVKVAIEVDSAFDLAISGGVQGRGLPFGFILGSSGSFYAVGRANETDTALARTIVLSSNIFEYGIAGDEYDANALLPRKIRTPGISTETDVAFPIALGTGPLVSVAIETDTAFAIGSPTRSYPTGRSDDFSYAFSLTRLIGTFVTYAAELDTAYRMAVNAQIVAIGDASETSVSFSPLVIKYNTVKTSVEVDTALALSKQTGPQVTVYAWRRVT